MSREIVLPSYATVNAKGYVDVDPSIFYPAYLKELWADENWPKEADCLKADGEPKHDMGFYLTLQRGEVDQYWLEVAFACMKMDIQKAMAGTTLISKKGSGIISVQDNTKTERANGEVLSDWALKAHPAGRGAKAAVQGREARAHYKRIRGGQL